MNYEEFKTILADHGIMPFTSILDTSIQSIARSNPDALKHFTGFSSPEEVYANVSREKLISLLESWLDEYASHYEKTIKDLTGFDSVEKFLDYDPRATDEDIRRVEEALDVSLPTDFVRFHKEYGANRRAGAYVYGKQDEYKVGFAGREWQSFYSVKWDEDGQCELVDEQEDWDWKGKFVKIGCFNEEHYYRDIGHFGFLIVDGKCRDSVVWLDHEYNSERLEEFADSGVEILVFLLGEVINGYTRVNYYEEDALVIAAIYGRIEMVGLLIEEGFNINHKCLTDVCDFFGCPALIPAANKGYINIVELLLKNGADINLQSNTGATSLMEAAAKGNTELVKLLLAQGAKINVKDERGVTALSMAAGQGNTSIVELLLAQGADVNMTNTKGETPI